MHTPSLLFFQAENIPPSLLPPLPKFPLPHLLHCDPSRSAAAFAAVSLPCLKCRKETDVQLTVSAPCNHFVSQKALLSNPHRQTGRGWIGERHLTPLPAFFPPFPIRGFALQVGQALGFSLLSLSACFSNCPERVKGIREMLQESSKAGENVLPEAGSAQQSAITQWEEKAVWPEKGFQQGLMEPQAWSPGMAPKCPWPLSGAGGH